MSSETDARQKVVKALRELDAVSVENGVGSGTPDVNYIGGWIELKCLDNWPARPETEVRVRHFRRGQRVWLWRRRHRGGDAWFLLKAGRDWVLLDGDVAATIVGYATRAELEAAAVAVWRGGLNEPDLLRCLKRT